MHTAHGNLHLEIQTSRKSPVGILRTSFRENGKMKHTQHGRITGCSLEQLKILHWLFVNASFPLMIRRRSGFSTAGNMAPAIRSWQSPGNWECTGCCIHVRSPG
jgi:hypothetical protein